MGEGKTFNTKGEETGMVAGPHRLSVGKAEQCFDSIPWQLP